MVSSAANASRKEVAPVASKKRNPMIIVTPVLYYVTVSKLLVVSLEVKREGHLPLD